VTSPAAPGRAEPLTAAPVRESANVNALVFWPTLVVVLVADLLTKAIAQYALAPRGFPHRVIGEWVRLTLVYNPGAAFGLSLGPWSRVLFIGLTAVAVPVLWRLYRATRPFDNRRTLAVALVMAGAIGNCIDRIRSAEGVVDFLDLGVGAWRWPTFNVADIAVTVGALLLARVLWDDEGEPAGAPPGPDA
jgi:signal peptidase II